MNPRPSVLSFNFDLAKYIDTSWIEKIPHGDIISKYRCHENTPPYISNYIMKCFDIDQQYYFSIPEEIQSIAFLDSDVLVDLIKHAGAIINYEKIRKTILKNEIELLKNTIGNDAYAFGLRPSPNFKCVVTDSKFLVGSKFSVEKDVDLGLFTVFLGVHCLVSALYEMPKCVRQRVLFKLPYEWVSRLGNQWDVSQSKDCIFLLNSIKNILNKPPAVI